MYSIVDVDSPQQVMDFVIQFAVDFADFQDSGIYLHSLSNTTYKVLQKTGIYYLFDSDGSLLNIVHDIAIDENDPLFGPYATIGLIYSTQPLSSDLYPLTKLYMFTNGESVFAVVAQEDGTYVHFGFGKFTDKISWSGGEFISDHAGCVVRLYNGSPTMSSLDYVGTSTAYEFQGKTDDYLKVVFNPVIEKINRDMSGNPLNGNGVAGSFPNKKLLLLNGQSIASILDDKWLILPLSHLAGSYSEPAIAYDRG